MNAISHRFRTFEQEELFQMLEEKSQKEIVQECQELQFQNDELLAANNDIKQELTQAMDTINGMKDWLVSLMPDNNRAHNGLDLEDLLGLFIDEVSELKGMF